MHTHTKKVHTVVLGWGMHLGIGFIRISFENFHPDVNVFIKSFILSFHTSSLFLFVFSSLLLLEINLGFHMLNRFCNINLSCLVKTLEFFRSN